MSGVVIRSSRVGEPERVPALVADPRVVHVEVVARQLAHDLAPAHVDLQVAAGAAVGAHAVGGRQVERARDEPVGRRRERADRADLDGVAAERRAEVLAGGDRDLLAGAAREQLDEPVAGDLGRRTACTARTARTARGRGSRAARAGAASRRSLRLDVAALAGSERERLVLQRALAAAVADRAVERVVEQQELEVRDLGLTGPRRSCSASSRPCPGRRPSCTR